MLQILVSAQSQSANCPICLSTPVAPRMAKCGHIFCLPCLIRYMHSSDDTNQTPEKKARWKKCPICWDSIYVSETRPVRWFTGQEGERPHEGGDVVLRLIMRQLGSTLALPRDGAEGLERADEVPWYFAAEVMDYARVMKGSENYMLEQYQNEIRDLQQQEKEDELMFGEETQWTKKAVASITEAKERAKELGNPPIVPQQPSERKPRRPPVEFREYGEDIPEYYLFQRAVKSGQSLPRILPDMQSTSSGSSAEQSREVSSPADDTRFQTAPPTKSNTSINTPAQPSPSYPEQPSVSRSRGTDGAGPHHHHGDSPFYFYEALLHYYLSPLDIRILKAAFGDFSCFPTTVLPRVERVSTGHIVDDELRRRAKYLSHLPQGCEVGFLECDWAEIVSPEVLKGFEVEIERRRKKNREKEVREEKERMRAEKEEDDKRWAAARRRKPAPSQDVISEVDFQPLPETSAVNFSVGSSSPPWTSPRAQEGSAFASLASPSTSPVASKTVWGTRLIPPTSPALPAISDEHEPSENDGWLQDWEKDLLQEEDLVAQIEATALVEGSCRQGPASGSGKKKKGKKITLMSTNARRGA